MPQAAPQQKTMDEALQESIAAHEAGQQEAPTEPQAEVDAPPEAEEQAPETPEGEEGQQAASEPKEEGEPEKPEAPKQAKPVKPTPKEGKDGKQPANKPIPALSAWPPHLRDQFHTLPRPVKDHIIKMHGDYVRREAEYSRQMHTAKQQQEAIKPLTEALTPFMPHLQAVGVAPAAAVRNLFQTEYALRTGAEGQKAAIVANLMHSYGVSPAALVAALEGKPAPEGQAAPPQRKEPEQPPRDPRFDAFLTTLQKQAQARQAAQDQQDEAALHEFLNSGKAEFFDDVAQDMTELATLKSNKGLSWEELYEKACFQNKSVRTVMEKRKADEAAALRAQKAQQARRAGSSVKTEPGAPQGTRKPSLEEALKRDIESIFGTQAV